MLSPVCFFLFCFPPLFAVFNSLIRHILLPRLEVEKFNHLARTSTRDQMTQRGRERERESKRMSEQHH